MEASLLATLAGITEEEQKILAGDRRVEKERYTDFRDFTVDSRKMLERGRLMDIRPHTRFVHFPDHKHNYVEIIYMCSGKTTHIIDRRDRVELQTGNLLFLNRNTSHEIVPAEQGDIAVNFINLPEFFDVALSMLPENNILSEFLISALRQGNRELPYLYFQVADALPVQNLVENMVWSSVTRQPNRRRVNQTTMGLLFLQLLNYLDTLQLPETEQFQPFPVVAALREIEENYREANLTELAQTHRLSVSRYSKLLQTATGATFKELLRQKRLTKAAELLSRTSLSVSDIIVAVGYDNNSYFYRAFRSVYGCSPADYRKLNGK